MRLRFVWIWVLALWAGMGFAQGLNDAVMFATTYYEGTGRSMGMAGATGALGGDLTAVCINPAGLGLYRSAELSFSTGIQHTFSHSDYYGQSQNDGRLRVTIPNFGYVLNLDCSNYRPLRSIQFAIGMNRTNDYNYHTDAKGLNPSSSMVDAWLQTIDGIDELYTTGNPGAYLEEYYPYDLNLAWRTYLVDRYQDLTGTFFNSPIPQGNVTQKNALTSRGRAEEYQLSVSTNFYDKLFFGGSISLAYLKKISNRTYTETPGNPDDPLNTFKEWSYQETLGDTAWGFNGKVGILYYPASCLRIGLAWHSPTSYTIGESWSTIGTSQLIENHQEVFRKYLSPNLYQSYDFVTPHTFVGSLAFFLGSHGLITLDADYHDYRTCKFKSNVFGFADANQDIRQTLKPSANLRLGTEWRLRQFFVRGGLAYYGSPYGFGEANGSVKKAAVGLGYATSSDIYWDFTYELTESTSIFSPYSYYVDNVNVAGEIVQRNWRNKLVITMKMKL